MHTVVYNRLWAGLALLAGVLKTRWRGGVGMLLEGAAATGGAINSGGVERGVTGGEGGLMATSAVSAAPTATLAPRPRRPS